MDEKTVGEGKVRQEYARPAQLAGTAVFAMRRLVKEIGSIASTRPGYIEHYGVHFPRNNAGDTVLFDVLETLFDVEYGKQHWRRSQLRHLVKDEDISRINSKAKAVLVGGGGLFISDSNPNTASGWQWRITLDKLEKLSAPLILFAVGFNQFRGSDGFPEIFTRHLEATVRKSAFLGMRNHGSIAKTKEYLPADLHGKVFYQPCMTTMLSDYHPTLRRDLPSLQAERARRPKRRLAVNLAFDRAEKRFGANADLYIDRIAKGLKAAAAAGWELELAVHAWDDEPAIEHLRQRDVAFTVKRLNLSAPYEIVKYYASVDAVVGMRGHAQMIPFGCGTPILSLISHDKLRYFLEDIDHTEWGVEIGAPDIDAQILNFTNQVSAQPGPLHDQIAEAKQALWRVTQHNLATTIRDALRSEGRSSNLTPNAPSA